MAKKKNKYRAVNQKDPEFRELLDRYLRYWPLFVLSTFCILLCSLIYLSFATPTYMSIASVIIKDEESNGSSKDNPGFSSLGLLSGLGTNSIENELGILRSKRMMNNVVKALDLNIRYFDGESFSIRELYKQSPFLIQLQQLDEKKLGEAITDELNSFELSVLDNQQIEITYPENDSTQVTDWDTPVSVDFASFTIRRNKNYVPSGEDGTLPPVVVKFESTEQVANAYRSKLLAELNDENATLIMLSLEDPIKEKSRDILNQVVFEYNREAIEDKNLIAENTAFFIDDRLNIINKELDSVETGKEQFKESNSLANLELGSTLIMQNASEYNVKQQEVNTQLELVTSMIRYLKAGKSDLLPSNIGINDPGVQQLIGEYNQLIIDRNRALIGSTESNPRVINLEQQINQLKSDLRTSFVRIRTNLRISRNNLQKQAGLIGSQISEVPAQERQFREIERQQNIKEALYLYLLQKREENSLALAATGPKAKIVDQAYTLPYKISPNSNIVLFASLLFGLALPFLYINAKTLLNNKVQNRADTRKITNGIPILGELPHMNSNDTVFQANNRSSLLEAFRILTTNIQHTLLKEAPQKNGVCLFVTSTVKGEGKTFVSINLAMTIASSGERVLVVGADLRNPQLNQYTTNGESLPGVSTYLKNEYTSLDSLIVDSKLHSNLKLLPSGPIPSNPSELLRKEKVDEMFKTLKGQFDYIIVDTAPSMLVADTFIIKKQSDLTLYVVRAGYTKKKLLEFVKDSIEEKKLTKAYLILNDVQLSELGYGNKYGYTYGQERPNAVKLLTVSIQRKLNYLKSWLNK